MTSLFLFLSLLNSSVPALSWAFELPAPQLEKLPNGLTVAWFDGETFPVLDAALLVKCGSSFDPPGLSGVARMMGGLLDRGSSRSTALQFSERLDSLAISRYASVSEENTVVGVHGLSEDAGEVLRALAEMALDPKFAEEEIKRAREEMVDSWRRIQDEAGGLASVLMSRLLSAGSIYGRSSLGSLHDLMAIRRSDIVALHRKCFRPDRAILVLAGRVPASKVRHSLQSLFSTWTVPQDVSPVIGPQRRYSNSRLSRGTLQVHSGKSDRIYFMDKPGATQVEIRVGLHGPSATSEWRYPLEVANALFGSYFSSRLNARLRDQLGLTYGIGSGFSYNRELSTFVIASQTHASQVAVFLKELQTLLEEFQTGKVADQEVSEARDFLLGGFPLEFTHVGAVASRWVIGHLYDLGPDYLNEYLRKVQSVTVQDVTQAIQKSIGQKKPWVVVVGDKAEVVKNLKDSKTTKRELIEFKFEDLQFPKSTPQRGPSGTGLQKVPQNES